MKKTLEEGNLEKIIEELQQNLELEEALEQVRAKALAMDHSEDLSMVSLAIFEELDKMNFANIKCGIGVIHLNRRCDIWTTTTTNTGDKILVVGDEKLIGHSLLEGIYNCWKDQIPFAYLLKGEDFNKYYDVISKTNYQLPKSSTAFVGQDLKHYFKAVFCPAGVLYAYSDSPFSKKEEYIMQRFADTFYLGFTRYNDLQKSEKQTKAAKIEAALESIRVSAMAMQSSEDLINVATMLREQMGALGQIELESSLVHLYDKVTDTFEAWFAYKKLNTTPTQILTGKAIVSKETEWSQEVMSNYESRFNEYTIVADGNMLKEHYHHLEKISEGLPEDITLVDYDEIGKLVIPDILYYHFSKFSGGALLMISFQEPSDESKELQKRASSVFDMAYQRFLDLKKMEGQAQKLVELNELKNTLYTNITHEFRTPLTVIKGMADALKTDIANNDLINVNKSLELIQRNGDGLLLLVNEMLDLAKIESGNMELQLVQADVVPYLKYLSESFQSLAIQSNIQLFVFSKIDKLIMDFDTIKLSTVVTNLLSNAIKFTTPRGEIEVFLNKIINNGQDCFEVKINDSGKGIAEEDLSNIFNRFYQVDSSISRAHEGTGIGLTLTRELVELMGGEINVESTLGKGSSFVFSIPIRNSAPFQENVIRIVKSPLIMPLSSEAIIVQSKTETADDSLPLVLIIEDNMDVAYYLQTCLMGRYQTMHAANGIVGIEIALQKIPDIIISDVMMPGKDGFEVCAALKSHDLTDHIPFILLTAKATLDDRLIGLGHGADAYLSKPFIKEELFTRLDQLILQRKKLQRKFENTGLSQVLNKSVEDVGAKFIKKVVKIVHADILDHNFGVAQLANKLNLSESQAYRKLKAITGKSAVAFIKLVKLQKAKKLVENSNLAISEIAYDSGFSDPAYFSRAFKDEFGIAPKTMRDL